MSGLVLGAKKIGDTEKVYYVDNDSHTLGIGATGSGKTRTIVLQTIGALALAEESMVIADIKGELHAYAAPVLKRLDYNVIVIDFKNPAKSHRYNYLQLVIDEVEKGNINKAIDYVWDITTALVGKNDNERDKIWNNGEASIIASSIMSVVIDNQKNKKYQNLTNVYFFIAEMCKTIGMKMPIVEYNKSLPDNHPAKGLLAVSDVAPKNTRGSFYTSALTTLRLFTNPLINSMTNISDFRLGDIGTKKTAVFMILPQEKETYYPLASLLVSQIYASGVQQAERRGGRLKVRINYILDEFGNFVNIPGFSTMLTAGRSLGIRFNLFVQGISQLEEKYGKEVTKTIIGNCENWIYLQSSDPDTLKLLSEALGPYTIRLSSVGTSHAKYSNVSTSQNFNYGGRELLKPDEIGAIERPYSLVILKGRKKMIMKSPDLSKWYFNKIYGLGDAEHNRRVIKMREDSRPERTISYTMDLWGIWKHFQAKLESEISMYN